MNAHNKRIFLVLLALWLCFNVNSQEQNALNVKRFSFASSLGILAVADGSTALLEFAFLLFNNDRLDIRNHIIISATSLSDSNAVKNDILGLNNKLSLGGFRRNGLFRPYGFIEGGIGFYETETKEMFDMPLSFNFGYGFGLDIFVLDNIAFLIEGGINHYIIDRERIFTPKIALGVRAYF